MKLTSLTFIVTNACNFNCTYCFQAKDSRTMDFETIDGAVDFFYPYFSHEEKVVVGFYGGEPLLAFEQVKYAVSRLLDKNKDREKRIGFSLTTNGSLIDREMLDFFERHNFMLTLSFDGLAQDTGRKEKSRDAILTKMKEIQAYRGIDFEINSVFTPETIHRLSDSLLYIIDEQGPDITFNISNMEQWAQSEQACLQEELDKLSDALETIYQKTGRIPVTNFMTPPKHSGLFRCNAGRNRMAVAPGGDLWGCFLFYDFFKNKTGHPQYGDYSLGSLDAFIRHSEVLYPSAMENYSELRQDFFQVEGDFCFLCHQMKNCKVCPVNAAYATGSLGKISCSQCSLIKIQSQACKDFHQRIS